MRQSKTIFTVLFTAALLFTGCDKKTEAPTEEAVKVVKTEVKDVVTKAVKEVTGDAVINDEIRIYQADNSDGKITRKTIQKGFEDAGFYIAANNGMNFPFKRDFNNTYYDQYALAGFYNKDIVAEFIKEYPSIGLFAPMTMSIYTKKGDNTISIATLTTKQMAKITGIPADHAGWKKLDDMLEKALKLALPTGKNIPYTNKTIEVDGPLTLEATSQMEGDWEDGLEDLQNDFESALTTNQFAMPAFNELTDEIDDTGYDFYSVYSICKIPVAYAVSKEYPEMGAYAPCSMYIYKKEGDNTVHYGIHHVNNWIHSMGITDKDATTILQSAMAKVKVMMDELAK